MKVSRVKNPFNVMPFGSFKQQHTERLGCRAHGQFGACLVLFVFGQYAKRPIEHYYRDNFCRRHTTSNLNFLTESRMLRKRRLLGVRRIRRTRLPDQSRTRPITRDHGRQRRILIGRVRHMFMARQGFTDFDSMI